MNFRDYIKNSIKKTDRVLEIGPLTRPIVAKKDSDNVFYADIRSTEQIKNLYSGNEYLDKTKINVVLEEIVDIDFVIDGDYEKTFQKTEKFDVVILSHVVEHIPNIIYFFLDIAKILNKNGKLFIIYPDKRYSFDHFRNESSFIDAYNVYLTNKNNSNQVFDFVFNVLPENDPRYFWDSNTFKNNDEDNRFQKALVARNLEEKGKYDNDVHYWPFSDNGFLKFLKDLHDAKLFGFEVSNFKETQKYTQEFFVELTYKKSDNSKIIDYINETDYNVKMKLKDDTIENLRITTYELKDEMGKIFEENKKLLELLNESNKLNKEQKTDIKIQKYEILKKKVLKVFRKK